MEYGATKRILYLKEKTISAERYISVDQARIITDVYRKDDSSPVILKRAEALNRCLAELPISIDAEELIVGNRTPGIRAGIVFPEAGISWLENEIYTLPYRQQDPFNVRQEDREEFLTEIVSFWKGRTMEDEIFSLFGDEIHGIETIVKINQKDHAQGHICPDVAKWLKYGPAGLLRLSLAGENIRTETKPFYQSVAKVMRGACTFIKRYGELAKEMSLMERDSGLAGNLDKISSACNNISEQPPSNFHEAVQSVWFLFVILHMESNASSFSPGRMDQYLLPFFRGDIRNGRDPAEMQEILDALFIKFNQIVYMRNEKSARYFAGFPTGFNITIGGQTSSGENAVNELSYFFLRAQEHVKLPQPNLTARLCRKTPAEFILECSRIIGLGTGMPQIVNDESILPSLLMSGLHEEDAIDYVLVGCVELSPQGNFLGWSDAAMFNMVKALELTINNGCCMLTGKQMGPKTGSLPGFKSYSDFEDAFRQQIDFFIERMIRCCEIVETCHQTHLPSPFLSAVINNCLHKGVDVTAGGAMYNTSGIQAIQVANIADSLAVLKKMVFEEKVLSGSNLLDALKNNFEGGEILRQQLINHVPKYGNDVEWVDNLGAEWVRYFAVKLKEYRNFRGGQYNLGLYTVSAHVPMGKNVAATPDGRLSGMPLADGGLSPMYGRDRSGPTAVMNSVSRIPSSLAPNGTLLNMKFLPSMFYGKDIEKFASFLKSFLCLPVHHVQFNVISADELRNAKKSPELYRGLTIRVAGYTAFFTELSSDLQDEIITRTTHGKDN